MLIEILKGIPVWVYFLLGYLILKGIKAMSPREVKLKKIFLTPLIFLFLMFNRNMDHIALFTISTMVGIAIGYMIYKDINIEVKTATKTLIIPGSILTLILGLFAFSRGFIVGYETAVNPVFASSTLFISVVTISSGITFGLILGRTFIYLYKYYKVNNKELAF